MTTLTEQLEASVNFERIKIRLKELQRAGIYLEIAGEAARRYANRMKEIDQYENARSNYEPWTFIVTKEQVIQRAKNTKAAYDRCMTIYNTIVKSL